MAYPSPRATHERLVCLKESEVKKIATGSNVEWYIMTVVIYFICSAVGFALAIYMVKLLAKTGF